ncbi:MAG: dihydrofolate reductase family protein [Anaerolineales bacterium]|jgi:2,5-diamino-6-(ribosylamino)-4(3H)-pyrimidinone 5'-phosphate reductase
MERPKVIVLNSASVDGRLAMSPDSLLLFGDERWQSIEGGDRFNVFEWLKTTHNVQATLEGSGSFVRRGEHPDPLPPIEGDPQHLYADFLPNTVLQREGHRGWFTAVDGRGRIRWMYKDEFPDEAWRGWHLLVLTCSATPAEYLTYLRRETIPYLVAGKSRVDLRTALGKMHSRLGVTSLLSTAGGILNGALLRDGLVDEINIEFLPAVIGGTDTPSLFTAPDLESGEWPIQLELISTQVQSGGQIWLRYRVGNKA